MELFLFGQTLNPNYGLCDLILKPMWNLQKLVQQFYNFTTVVYFLLYIFITVNLDISPYVY